MGSRGRLFAYFLAAESRPAWRDETRPQSLAKACRQSKQRSKSASNLVPSSARSYQNKSALRCHSALVCIPNCQCLGHSFLLGSAGLHELAQTDHQHRTSGSRQSASNKSAANHSKRGRPWGGLQPIRAPIHIDATGPLRASYSAGAVPLSSAGASLSTGLRLSM